MAISNELFHLGICHFVQKPYNGHICQERKESYLLSKYSQVQTNSELVQAGGPAVIVLLICSTNACYFKKTYRRLDTHTHYRHGLGLSCAFITDI
jgi:hypothetical protein